MKKYIAPIIFALFASLILGPIALAFVFLCIFCFEIVDYVYDGGLG